MILASRISLQGGGIIFVIIDSPAHGVSKTVKTDIAKTVGDLKTKFLEKNPVKNPNEYGLVYLGKNFKYKKRKDLPFLKETLTILAAHIENMVRAIPLLRLHR